MASVFQHLRKKRFSARAYETGHSAYDDFLKAALNWKGSFAAVETAVKEDPAALRREFPFLVQVENEDGESLGLAMLINAYAMPVHGFDWEGWQNNMPDMGSFRRYFYDFTRTLPQARISADDATALLSEIPDTLLKDDMLLFEELFLKSFPNDCPAPARAALGESLANFFRSDILSRSNAKGIIARHERLWTHLGRDPLELPFYRERERITDLARKQAARFLNQVGPVHRRLAAATPPDAEMLPEPLRREFKQEVAAASPAERGQMIADACFSRLTRPAAANVEQWLRAIDGLPPRNLMMTQEDLVAQLRMPMVLTQDQACRILEYVARHGTRYASNYPALDYPLAQKLAPYLPVGRADLERLVKLTDHETDQAVKDLLIDALRGTRRGWVERMLRRFIPRLFTPQDLPELWDQWIEAKRNMLLNAIATRKPMGMAAPESPSVREWGAVNGQVYDLDVIGYAKRVALAQSHGADITAWLEDLGSLASMIRGNLERLEASTPTNDLSGRNSADGDQPSLYGLWSEPTAGQLVDCERRTLASLDKLIGRIELCRRHPDLAPFEHRMRQLTRGQDFSFHSGLFAHGIEMATGEGVPDALLERIEGFDFALLGGPYVEDSEPSFIEYEVEAWRSSIQALAGLPEKVAGPRLEAVAGIMFAPELDPDRTDHAFATKGYRQDILGEAVIRTLVAMPGQTGVATLRRLQARATNPRLQDRFAEAVQQIGYKSR